MRVLDGVRGRLDDSLARAGLALPWWVAAGSSGFGALFAVVAVGQRGALVPPEPLALAGVLAVTSALVWVVRAVITPPWFKAATVIVAAAVLFTKPVVPDFAPIMLVVLAAEMAAIAGPVVAGTVTGVCVALLGVVWGSVGLVGAPVYMVAVLLGFTGGYMFRWYVRALEAERASQQSAREQAILAERQRIAREVHDVVAHSLSITLLHLTGARRALQQDRDVDDAIDGLTEAERVGRAAMAEIRRTVGLLANSPASLRPLPGAADIAGLVEETRAAGLDVRYDQVGALTAVGDVAGLGLYRIVQESLANVAKHAPDAVARIRLHVGADDGIRLTVRNGLATPPGPVSDGSGLTGMSARARQLGAVLRAGPDGGDWLVDVTVPVERCAPTEFGGEHLGDGR